MMNKKGFTLLEILIVITILVLLIVGLIIVINPVFQIKKAHDTQKISDLDVLRKALEDYYNDKNCYPTLSQLCYLGGANGDDLSSQTSCYICGNESQSPTLKPYMSRLPCDPDHPRKKYIYHTEGNPSCPNIYKLYTDFNIADNPLSIDVGCATGGCGIPGIFGYDYGVSSENVSLDISPYFYCLNIGNGCDNCISYLACSRNSRCKKIYGTLEVCCLENRYAKSCSNYL